MTYIIAEVGGNHDGSLEKAKDLVRLAADCGCDAVKFQTYSAEKLVHPDTPALPQAKGYTSQIDRFRDLEFSESQWMEIIGCCRTENIDFMTTCFDVESLERYAKYMPMIKIASGDLTYHSLIREAAFYGKPVLLSTGMAEMWEIEQAVQWVDRDQLTVMHCVSSYPTQIQDANLGVLLAFRERFFRIGYSDHTLGNLACITAVAMGCSVIEKHFTNTPDKDIGDHGLSASPSAMAHLVSSIRDIETMMGMDKPAACELDNRIKMRRGAYALKDIEKGEFITPDKIEALRPCHGRTYEHWLGKRINHDVKKGDCLG